MNAASAKHLISVARKAREALLELDPDSIIALELWSAIQRAQAPAARSNLLEQCVFCGQAGAELGGFSKKCQWGMAHIVCAEVYHTRAAAFAQWCEQPRQTDYGYTRAEREALRERLSHCACSHLASEHDEDYDDNLLHCHECSCSHFHYATVTTDAPTITLDKIAVIDEPAIMDKLRKLQAVHITRGATADEMIAAQQRMAALMYRYHITSVTTI